MENTNHCLSLGAIDTDLARHMKEGFFGKMLYNITRHFIKTPLQGSQTTIYCALEPKIENDNGKYYSGCKETQPQRLARIEADQKKLWEISEELVGLKKE